MQGPSPGRVALRACVFLAALAALAALCSSTATAFAAEPTAALAPEPPLASELSLTWRAPAGCPTPPEVEAQFIRLLGGAARTPSGKKISASALVRATSPERWSLELATVLDGAEGRRSFSGDSCASVASAAALILALMIDPAAAERASAGAEPERAPAPPPSAREPEGLVVMTPTQPRALFGSARAFAGAVVGLLPTPAPAAGAALGARYARLGVELLVLATEERRVLVGAAGGGNFRLLVGGARACGVLGGHVVVWQACLGGELERLTGTGTRALTAIMGAGTGGLLVTLPLGARAALSLDLAAAVRPYHPAFFLGDDGASPAPPQILRVPTASGFAALGLIVTI